MVKVSKIAPKQETANACWSCKAAANAELFCPQCGKIQPVERGTDFFGFFGLPRRLNLDREELERKFHALSWKLHPDNFYNASPYEQQISIECSAILNDAYRALREPLARVEYLLVLEGVRKEGETKQQAPPDLLEEVFELNEYLDEMRAAKRGQQDGGKLAALRLHLEAARQTFEAKLREVDEALFGTFAEWDALPDRSASESERHAVLAKVSEILNRRSYMRNLVREVIKELEE